MQKCIVDKRNFIKEINRRVILNGDKTIMVS